MTDIIQLKTARYKGVEFLFQDATTTGGNRLLKYNYPGSDKQAIERQGKAPRSFTLTIWIPHDSYYQQRDNLLRVLEDGRKGVLTHPTYGDVNNVINGLYTLTEKQSELGKASISVVFEVDDSPGIPRQSGNLATQVQQESILLNNQLEEDLGNNYDASTEFSGNFTDAIANIVGVADSVEAAATRVQPSADKAAEYAKAVRDLRNGAGSLAQAPFDLASEIKSIFSATNDLYETVEDTFLVIKELFGFGDDDPEIKTNTVGRSIRKKNRDLIRANMRTQALSYAYLNASQITYVTTDDLESTQDELEAQYVDIRVNQLLSNESLEQLDRLRVQALKVLDEARVNTRSIISINTPLIPLRTLVYSRYGSTELMDTVAELNNVKQNNFVEGEVRILTS